MNWKSIIATALITGVVTVVTGMTLFWWQSERSELTYNSIQSIPFDDSSNKLFIQQIEIFNSGDKVVEDVIFVLTFSGEKIQKSKITIDKAISNQQKVDEKSIELRIDSLNPNEGASISVLFQSSNAFAGGGAVSLRGKGVTGKLIGSRGEKSKAPIFISLMAAYAGVFAFLLSTKIGRRAFSLIFKSVILGRSVASLGNQKNVIASMLAMYGYPEKAKEYLQSESARLYWVEADLLASEAINSDEKMRKDTVEILKQIGNMETIAGGSRAIILYNIARISKISDADPSVISQYLELAKSLDKNEVERRLEIDPIFLASKESNMKSHVGVSRVVPVN